MNDVRLSRDAARRWIVNGMLTVDVEFTMSREIVDELADKLDYERFDSEGAARNFAYIIGRNHAIDCARRAVRAEARSVEQSHRDAARIELLEKEARMTGQFVRAALAALAGGAKDNHIMMVWYRCFERLTDAQIADEKFPNTSRDVRDQWKRRGIKSLAPHSSPELWDYFGPKGSEEGYLKIAQQRRAAEKPVRR